VLIEFADFQCPFCARFVRDTYPELRREFIESGRLKHVFRNVPLPIHPLALQAAVAAECAHEQGRYWEMNRRLFAHQDALESEHLREHARAVGLDDTRFGECIAQGTVTERIGRDLSEAERLGIRSTPTFFIGTAEPSGETRLLMRIAGAQPYQEFKSALDEAASHADRPGAFSGLSDTVRAFLFGRRIKESQRSKHEHQNSALGDDRVSRRDPGRPVDRQAGVGAGRFVYRGRDRSRGAGVHGRRWQRRHQRLQLQLRVRAPLLRLRPRTRPTDLRE
jgi:hypothetical protein